MIWSFDYPEIGWTLNQYATIVADQTAPTPPNALNLNCGGFIAASCRRMVTLASNPELVPGNVYPVWAWVNFDAMTAPGLPVRIYYEGTGLDVMLNRLVDDFGDPLPPQGWELRFVGNWAYDLPDFNFYLLGISSSSSLGAIRVDAIYVGEIPYQLAADMARKWSAIAAAIAAIKDINGATDSYNVDLEGRVYSRLFLPSEEPTVTLPYCCVPLNQEGETVSYEGFAFTSTYRLTGWAFFADNPESDVLDSAGGVLAAKFRDDLIRSFMADQTLGGQAQNVEVTSIETGMGDIGDPTTWVMFTIEFTQQAGADDLQAA